MLAKGSFAHCCRQKSEQENLRKRHESLQVMRCKLAQSTSQIGTYIAPTSTTGTTLSNNDNPDDERDEEHQEREEDASEDEETKKEGKEGDEGLRNFLTALDLKLRIKRTYNDVDLAKESEEEIVIRLKKPAFGFRRIVKIEVHLEESKEEIVIRLKKPAFEFRRIVKIEVHSKFYLEVYAETPTGAILHRHNLPAGGY